MLLVLVDEVTHPLSMVELGFSKDAIHKPTFASAYDIQTLQGNHVDYDEPVIGSVCNSH